MPPPSLPISLQIFNVAPITLYIHLLPGLVAHKLACLQVCDLFGVLMRKGIALIEACDCTATTGCPGCIQHTTCNQYNAVLDKKAGIIVLQVDLLTLSRPSMQ